ncbi:hypothetical protein BN871_JW_00010 [Paenibacillus sp. P22]|nr:hypothetical protein BN871_JW_00010 [Paenibacillus sp. P22]
MQIRYVRYPQNVTLVSVISATDRPVRFIAQSRAFSRITGVSLNAVLGCTTLDADQLRQLGFILKGGEIDAPVSDNIAV